MPPSRQKKVALSPSRWRDVLAPLPDAHDSDERNAAESAFGWQFQILSSIVFMLSSLEEYEEIDVEGMKEDIEILMKSGKRLYIQVKSMYEPLAPLRTEKEQCYRYNARAYEHIRNAVKGLKKTYDGFTDEQKEKCSRFVYLSNIENPFGVFCDSPWRDFRIVDYDELEPKEKESVRNLGLDFILQHTDLFSFSVLECRHSTREDNERRYVLKEISNFLNKLGISESNAKAYCERLYCLCFHCAANKRYKLHKDVFLTAAIEMKMRYSDELYHNLLSSCEIESSELEGRYKTTINSFIHRFNVYTSVVSDFLDYSREVSSVIQNYNERKYRFASINATEFARLYLQNIEEGYRKPLAMYIIAKILEVKQHVSDANRLFH